MMCHHGEIWGIPQVFITREQQQQQEEHQEHPMRTSRRNGWWEGNFSILLLLLASRRILSIRPGGRAHRGSRRRETKAQHPSTTGGGWWWWWWSVVFRSLHQSTLSPPTGHSDVRMQQDPLLLVGSNVSTAAAAAAIPTSYLGEEHQSLITFKSCSDWEKGQSGLFQAANYLAAASFLIPHHTFRWSIFGGRILLGLAHLLIALWASGLVLCVPDLFAWHLLMTLGNGVHVAYWSWRFRPARIRPPLLELYTKLFLPLDTSQDHFVQLTSNSVLRKMEPGDEYFRSFDPAHPMRLSFLLSGKLKVTFGSSRRLLHHISPFQFVDSPEWYTTQYAFPTDVKASKPQVAIAAEEPSTLLQLDPDHLRQILATNPRLKFLLDCLIGKDVSEKLYAVAEEQAALLSSLTPSSCQAQQHQAEQGGGGGRLSSLRVGGSVVSTSGSSSINPWDSELLRSQSADAVHTSKQGQMRSIHWRRDQTRKIWARKYEKLVPSHHQQMSSLLKPDNNSLAAPTMLKTRPHHQLTPSIKSPKPSPASVRKKEEQFIRRVSPHQVQFGETFV